MPQTMIYRQVITGRRAAVLALCSLSLTSCVTINIYFPAAAAEKAADKVIDEVWQIPAEQAPSNTPSSVPTAAPVAPSAMPVTPSVNQELAP